MERPVVLIAPRIVPERDHRAKQEIHIGIGIDDYAVRIHGNRSYVLRRRTMHAVRVGGNQRKVIIAED